MKVVDKFSGQMFDLRILWQTPRVKSQRKARYTYVNRHKAGESALLVVAIVVGVALIVMMGGAN